MLMTEHCFQKKKRNENRIQSCFQPLQMFWITNTHRLQVKTIQNRMIFSPAPGHFKQLTLLSTAIRTDSSSSLPEIPKQKKENEETRQKRQNQKYLDAEETKPVRIGETGMITFMRNFKYLVIYISCSLKDYYDIEHRILYASAEMGALKKFWADDTVANFSKHLFFCAIPWNLLLWVCKSWAIHKETRNKLEVFLHINIRKYSKSQQQW